MPFQNLSNVDILEPGCKAAQCETQPRVGVGCQRSSWKTQISPAVHVQLPPEASRCVAQMPCLEQIASPGAQAGKAARAAGTGEAYTSEAPAMHVNVLLCERMPVSTVSSVNVLDWAPPYSPPLCSRCCTVACCITGRVCEWCHRAQCFSVIACAMGWPSSHAQSRGGRLQSREGTNERSYFDLEQLRQWPLRQLTGTHSRNKPGQRAHSRQVNTLI